MTERDRAIQEMERVKERVVQVKERVISDTEEMMHVLRVYLFYADCSPRLT